MVVVARESERRRTQAARGVGGACAWRSVGACARRRYDNTTPKLDPTRAINKTWYPLYKRAAAYRPPGHRLSARVPSSFPGARASETNNNKTPSRGPTCAPPAVGFPQNAESRPSSNPYDSRDCPEARSTDSTTMATTLAQPLLAVGSGSDNDADAAADNEQQQQQQHRPQPAPLPDARTLDHAMAVARACSVTGPVDITGLAPVKARAPPKAGGDGGQEVRARANVDARAKSVSPDQSLFRSPAALLPFPSPVLSAPVPTGARARSPLCAAPANERRAPSPPTTPPNGEEESETPPIRSIARDAGRRAPARLEGNSASRLELEF